MTRLRNGWIVVWASCWALCWAVPAGAAEVAVAAASNFAAPIKRLATAFEQASGHRLRVSLGSTGSLYAQVLHGAPFQVFLSADQKTAQALERQGHAVLGSRTTYATGRLVLWSATPGLVDPQGHVLRSGRFERLAVANPKLAPYGAAALEVMDKLGVAAELRGRLVQAENIAQAHQFTASGNAQLGFLAFSQVQLDGRLSGGSGWLVPAELHVALKQDAVLLQRGAGAAAAQAFMEFLRGPEARAIIRAHGYEN